MLQVYFLLVSLIYLTNGHPLSEEMPDWEFNDYKRTALGDSIDVASMKMLKEVYLDSDDKNTVASPVGVLLLLSLYSAGANDQIKDELVRSLGATNYDELSKAYSQLSEELSAIDPSYFNLANKVFVGGDVELIDSFAKTARGAFHSEVDKIDFRDVKAAVAQINRWAEEKTRGHIKSPVAEDAISPDVTAALFNVVFFQGHWHVPFNASETVEKDFHEDKSTVVKKPTMHLEMSLAYHENPELGARLIEIPYKEKGFRMVIVLPDEIDGLSAVVEKVAQNGILSDVIKLVPQNSEVHLDLPRFEVKSGLNLNDLLPKVGVSKIFSEVAPGIARGLPVRVSKAMQEAFVRVDEEGATAGAFTGLVAVPMSSWSKPHVTEFKVDHPFLFAILHEDKVLFTGTYSH